MSPFLLLCVLCRSWANTPPPLPVKFKRFAWNAVPLEFFVCTAVFTNSHRGRQLTSWAYAGSFFFSNSLSALVRMLHIIFTYFMTAARTWCCSWSCFIPVMCSCIDHLFTLQKMYRNCCYCYSQFAFFLFVIRPLLDTCRFCDIKFDLCYMGKAYLCGTALVWHWHWRSLLWRSQDFLPEASFTARVAEH